MEKNKFSAQVWLLKVKTMNILMENMDLRDKNIMGHIVKETMNVKQKGLIKKQFTLI